jgi:hypothetical protein
MTAARSHRQLQNKTAFYYAYTLDSPGMIMRVPRVGSQYLMGFLDADRGVKPARMPNLDLRQSPLSRRR